MMMNKQRTDDATLQRYLMDLGTSTPLEPGDEQQLGRRMRQARESLLETFKSLPGSCRNQILGEIGDLNLTPDLPFDTLDDLVERLDEMAATESDETVAALAGQARKHFSELGEIREKFISCNLRLVVHVAKRFTKHGAPLLDLIQEGNVGLMRAVDRFDPGRGARFSTYAVNWINQALLRESPDLNRIVKIPEYQDRRRQCLSSAIRELTHRLGRKPNLWEIAEEAGLSMDKVTDALTHNLESVDLEEPFDGEDGPSLMDILPDEDARAPFEEVATRYLVDRLDKSLAALLPRHREVIRLRYGMDEDRPYTLREIGKRLHVSAERIRQIEFEALNVLRNSITKPENGNHAQRSRKSGVGTSSRPDVQVRGRLRTASAG